MPKQRNKPVEKDMVKLEKLEVVYVDIESIHPNAYNPNRQSQHDFELLCRSIEEDGFTQPVIVNRETNEIVDGEHRWRACKSLGHKKIAVVLTDMTTAQQMIATLRHNRARGNENINMASDVLRELQSMGSLDQASESLMLDNLDLTIMLQDVPTGELHLRTEGENYSVQEVEGMINEEKKAVQDRKAEEALMSIKDSDKYTFQFTYPWTEGWIVDRLALGRNKKKNKANELLALCKKWGHIE